MKVRTLSPSVCFESVLCYISIIATYFLEFEAKMDAFTYRSGSISVLPGQSLSERGSLLRETSSRLQV